MKVGVTTSRVLKRTIPITHCNGQFLNRATNDFEDFYGMFYGETDEAKATKYYRGLLDNDSIVINNCEIEYRVYNLPVSEIIENYNYELA